MPMKKVDFCGFYSHLTRTNIEKQNIEKLNVLLSNCDKTDSAMYQSSISGI